eukprot:TRINITY_DN1259_c0_g1_i3.p1 TRINITY_DN1259_c0_g1~~TRINITY_DN1259_c0_g1_i3.p1  ORF type:complete len:275 (+),score=114.25 TRINITY_DN1259_c0_g1_i3:40-825(+)
MADDEEVADIPLFDPSMKKKKKKKKKLDDVPEGEAEAPATDEPAEAPAGDADEEAADEELSLDFGSKKKKKKKAVVVEEPESDEDEADEAVESGAAAWEGTDREYTYKELLERVFSILEQSNPDLVSKKRSRMVMKPPSVFREGTKKTVWANFQDICKSLGRSTEHVQAFALAELGTNGSVDGSYRLVIKGRFNPKQIESVIKHYITEYVTCRTCKSHETNLKKENRLYFVQCRACGSSRSVAAIKTGFQAQVTKRRRRKV